MRKSPDVSEVIKIKKTIGKKKRTKSYTLQERRQLSYIWMEEAGFPKLMLSCG